ncbi:GTPase IMAP family member 8-like [Oryzias melastigma]|uniref:GTPase IMAP family member 8-like n=1 Tax=Oryzias melastigma TaxID=30732 RepID=UPI00168CD75D|nr:GTPase IMAP family member 8-like [Oryzias melastigma]
MQLPAIFPSKLYGWSALTWTLLWLFHRPSAGLIQYSAAELLRLRYQPAGPPLLHFRTDSPLTPRRRYIHRGTRRQFRDDTSKHIQFSSSTTRCPPRYSGRPVDHSVLSSLPRLGNEAGSAMRQDSATINFGLINIRSLSNKERRLTVVDSPSWLYFHTLQNTSEMDKLEIENSLYMCPPGPHAVILVIDLGTAFSAKCQRSVQDHMSLFGDDVWKHTIILFTRLDWLGVKTVEERIESEKGLQWLVNKCENRYHAMNNLERNNREQVKVLLEKIEEMWAENDDPYYEVDQRRAAEMETLREDADKRAKKMKKIIERQSRVLKEIFKEERQSLSDFRVVLLGQKGSGKSIAGNRILFMEKFEEGFHTACFKKDKEDQRVSVKHQADFDGVKVSVVEAPGWYKDTKAPDWLKHEVHRSVSMCDPGPHAFLLVVPVHKSFTEKDLREFVELLKPFTEKVWAHCMVLFTWGQWLGKHSIEDHIFFFSSESCGED